MTPSRSGFTLVELLVVVVLLGLAATVCSVALRGATSAARLRGATIRIEQALRQASLTAARRLAPVALEFQIGSGRFRIGSGEQSPWQVLHGVVVQAARFRGGIEMRGTGQVFAARVAVGGVGLPWELELADGAARRMVWHDGFGERVQWRADSPATANSSAGVRP